MINSHSQLNEQEVRVSTPSFSNLLLTGSIHTPQGHLDERPEQEFAAYLLRMHTSASPELDLKGCSCGPISVKGGLVSI